MSWFATLLARHPRADARGTGSTSSNHDDGRRQLLAIAVRDTLRRHGIPSTWITLDPLPFSKPGRPRGMHVRLVIREWDSRLPPYMVALEREIASSVRRMDPLSSAWLAGVSWRFNLVDDQHCPKLPPPQSWLAAPTLPTTSNTRRPPVLVDRFLGEPRPDFAPTQPLSEHALGRAA